MRKQSLISTFFCITVILAAMGVGIALADDIGLTRMERLGKFLFFDKNLSEPKGQSCAACHSPEVGFTGADQVVNATIAVYPGAVPTRFGNRKPPSAAYAGDSPILYYDSTAKMWIGGMFWDGRATGETLGDPLAEQAQGPFLNPLEQNNPNAKAVVDKVLASWYRGLFKQVCGSTYEVAKYYECIARSIAAYERSKEVSQFKSKYDRWLRGKAMLTKQEDDGRKLFEDKDKAKCANCHKPPLFTDFTYDNLGIPKNPLNPFYYEPDWNPLGTAWIDEGLGGFLKNIPGQPYATEIGKFKVPTLRNVDKRPNQLVVKDYGHNGYFKSLKEIVHFYNTRDTLPTCAQGSPGEKITCWPQPEVASNINTAEVGNLGLTSDEEDSIVAFLSTLSDTEGRCLDSDTHASVIIEDCDTSVENKLVDDGYTMSDLITQCADGAKNHGIFVSCVSHHTNNWKKVGLISGKEKGKIQSCAAKSDIP